MSNGNIKKKEILNNLYILVFSFFLYLIFVTARASYIGEKENRQISNKEFYILVLKTPIDILRYIFELDSNNLEISHLEKCFIQCQRKEIKK
jgi:hypothetical protein